MVSADFAATTNPTVGLAKGRSGSPPGSERRVIDGFAARVDSFKGEMFVGRMSRREYLVVPYVRSEVELAGKGRANSSGPRRM